jgi:hypothetical protein
MLFCDALDAWVHVNFLVGLKFLEKFRCNAVVMPRQVKLIREGQISFPIPDGAAVVFLLKHELHSVHFLSSLHNNWVLGLFNVNSDLGLYFVDYFSDLFAC